jgi:SAM-dependent methyltransferase
MIMDDRSALLVALGRALQAAGYAFVTVTPETHRRVARRAAAAGLGEARSVRDVFGWNRPFDPSVLPARVLELARAAGVVVEEGRWLRSTVRFSSLGGHLLLHSAFPTLATDAVFFGPDTYRYCDLLERELRARPPARRVVDVGCGSGAGGIVAAARSAERVVLADINPAALAFAAVNAELAGMTDRVELAESDVMRDVDGEVDLVIANPPYMADPASRAYRDGGGAYGEALAVRIARDALERLSPGGRLVLYTGAAVVDGVDTFLEVARGVCDRARAEWTYREIDPDVFGEEIEQNEAYASVERIAAVALVAQVGR